MAELKRSLGFWTIIALILTSLIGTGMFFGTAIGAGKAGNAVLISWMIVIAIGVYVAACFGELIALLPKAGGVYEFSKHAYGRFFSFMIGWLTWVMSNISVVILIVAALNYILPPGFNQTIVWVIDYKILISLAIIFILNIVAYLGIDTSAGMLIFFATVMIAVFLAIIIPGVPIVNLSNFSPFFSHPFIFIFAASFFLMEALTGWESASFLSEETKNPERVIPKALIVSTLIAGLLSLGAAFVSLGVIPWQVLARSVAPMNDVANMIFGAAGTRIISIGIVLAFIGSAAGTVIAAPRLVLAMARDKLFISQLAAVHPKRMTPYKAIIFQTIVTVLLLFVAFGSYQLLIQMYTPLALIMYVFVLLALPILRIKMKDAKREFKVPFGKTGPVLISLIYLGIITAWLITEPSAINIFKLALSLVFFGVPIYILLIFFYNPDAVVGFTNRFAHLALLFENVLFPKRVQRQVLEIFKDLKDKSILEFGAGVGTLTIHLAERVGPDGKVYATELSEVNTRLLNKRLSKRGIRHVQVIHDAHQVNRVHPDVGRVDMIFSVGMIGYLQDFKKVLREMHRRLPESGRICFVEYVDFFKILPDPEWLSDTDKLKKTFREAGFSVQIDLRKGLFWNYLFIYGIKSDRDVPVI